MEKFSKFCYGVRALSIGVAIGTFTVAYLNEIGAFDIPKNGIKKLVKKANEKVNKEED
jgi:hypothetical protein